MFLIDQTPKTSQRFISAVLMIEGAASCLKLKAIEKSMFG
jgi:hypothetical protein